MSLARICVGLVDRCTYARARTRTRTRWETFCSAQAIIDSRLLQKSQASFGTGQPTYFISSPCPGREGTKSWGAAKKDWALQVEVGLGLGSGVDVVGDGLCTVQTCFVLTYRMEHCCIALQYRGAR